MSDAKGKGGGLQFSGKHIAKEGGDGSPLPAKKNPSGDKATKAPGTVEKATGPSCY